MDMQSHLKANPTPPGIPVLGGVTHGYIRCVCGSRGHEPQEGVETGPSMLGGKEATESEKGQWPAGLRNGKLAPCRAVQSLGHRPRCTDSKLSREEICGRLKKPSCVVHLRVRFPASREGGEWAMSRRVWCWLGWRARVGKEQKQVLSRHGRRGWRGLRCWEQQVLFGGGLFQGQGEFITWGFCAVSTRAPGASRKPCLAILHRRVAQYSFPTTASGSNQYQGIPSCLGVRNPTVSLG